MSLDSQSLIIAIQLFMRLVGVRLKNATQSSRIWSTFWGTISVRIT
jgi:hypothetical protein